jgi:hypothetical protein
MIKLYRFNKDLYTKLEELNENNNLCLKKFESDFVNFLNYDYHYILTLLINVLAMLIKSLNGLYGYSGKLF